MLGLGVGGTSLRRSRGSQFDVTARTTQSRPHLQSRPGQATNVKMQGLGLHVLLFAQVAGSKQVSVSCIVSGLFNLWCCRWAVAPLKPPSRMYPPRCHCSSHILPFSHMSPAVCGGADVAVLSIAQSPESIHPSTSFSCIPSPTRQPRRTWPRHPPCTPPGTLQTCSAAS